ncbi:MAG: zinc ribbon domain-containing protein [Ruminiclostridium sp.]|nr:zinc ribbon domain-containing protein [Ruminiclostridium sp.]
MAKKYIGMRQALNIIERVQKKEKKHYGITAAFFTLNEAKYHIKKLPTANVQEVKHGRWIAELRGLYHGINLLDDKNFKGLPMYSCSECKEKVIYKGNYCPNCGAKMDVGEDITNINVK